MSVHKEFSRFDVQLLGDVFADFDQRFTAVSAGARLRLMAMFDAWQMLT
jgi:hypothetical protein